MSTTDQAPPPAFPEPVPLPLRVAAVLSAIVGVVTMVAAIGGRLTGPEAARYGVVTTAFGLVAGASLCVGSVLVFRRRQLGAVLVLIACVCPTVVGVFTTGRVHSPPLLLILATITVLANWRLLR